MSAAAAPAQSASGHVTASATVVEPASVSVRSGRFWAGNAGSVEIQGAVSVGGRTQAVTRVESQPVRITPATRIAAAAPALGRTGLPIPGTEQQVRGSVSRLPAADEAVSYRVELLN